jgi:hypothetical protein
MDTKQGTTSQELTEDQHRTPEQVRGEIEQTRAELGDTVAALSAKTDVKAQAARAATEAKDTVTGKVSDVKDTVTATKSEFVSSARATTPDSALDAGQRVSAFAQQNSRVLSVLAAFGLGLAIGRRTAP